MEKVTETCEAHKKVGNGTENLKCFSKFLFCLQIFSIIRIFGWRSSQNEKFLIKTLETIVKMKHFKSTSIN